MGVRPLWVGVAFVAGILVGVVGVRLAGDAPDVSTPADSLFARAPESNDRSAPPPATSAGQASSSTQQVAASPPARSAPTTAAQQPDVAPNIATTPSTPPASAMTAPAMPADGHNPFPPLAADDGSPVLQPLDVGEAFREAMKKLTPEGDTIADAHRALERETRDENWAWQSASNIENTLIPETAAGNFKSHYVECRATLCEVRLSASNEAQGEALRVWADGLGKQPWAKNLFPMYSSSITKNGRTDRIVILRRPK